MVDGERPTSLGAVDGRVVEVLVVGAGFAGIEAIHRLREAGFDALLLEAGSAPGGIWYWNCYPGARVDSHVPVYEYADPSVWRDWYWEERFPDRRALRRYFDHVVDRWGLAEHMVLGAQLVGACWSESDRRWRVEVGQGRWIEASFLVLCTGFASKPYIPDLPGLGSFGGACHHTARWPQEGVELSGRRVGVIGTGASGVQVVQEAARVAERLTVFQRTPILALPMQQRRLSREEQDEAKRSYPDIFGARLRSGSGFDYPDRGSGAEVPAVERLRVYEELWNSGGLAFWAGNYADLLVDERLNREAYDFWRDKVRARIEDPALHELLAPTEPPHPFGVKRPSLEQGYYEVFNQPNVSLIDIRAAPIDRVTCRGVRVGSDEHELDVLVLATGFDAVTGGLTSMELRGAKGRTLRDHWADGVRTHLGVACHEFPNAFFVYGPQSPAGFCNGPTCAEVQTEWLTGVLVRLRAEGVDRIEATAEAEQEWREQVEFIASLTLFPRADSWYMGANVPGKRREMLNWPGGLQLYRSRIAASVEDGLAGFTLGRSRDQRSKAVT